MEDIMLTAGIKNGMGVLRAETGHSFDVEFQIAFFLITTYAKASSAGSAPGGGC